jgi:putative oxidoreductase
MMPAFHISAYRCQHKNLFTPISSSWPNAKLNQRAKLAKAGSNFRDEKLTQRPFALCYRRNGVELGKLRNSMHPTLTPLPAVGRILLAFIFVLAGITQLGDMSTTVSHMASHGIPYSSDLVWGVVALELGGGILLIVGFLTRLVAAAYFFYLMALAVIFHDYWTMTGAQAHAQHADFNQHLAIMGGMLFVVAFGAGPYSIDALIRGRRSATAVPQPAE